jgi:hypothetical protein
MGQQIGEQQNEDEEQDIQDIPQLLIPGGERKKDYRSLVSDLSHGLLNP